MTLRLLPRCGSRLFRSAIGCSSVQPSHGSSLLRYFSSKGKKTVSLTFVFPDGKKEIAKGEIGDSLLDVVLKNYIDIDGFGACEGTMACSTCHLVFAPDEYRRLPDEPPEEEMDMLDLAFGLTDTSRLGCQIQVSESMDGWTLRVPDGRADARGEL